MFMFKKIVVGTVAAAALGTFVLGRDAASYLRTGVGNVQHAVRAEVPVEFEIDRARHEISQIVPEIEQCMHVIAEQQYDLEQRVSQLGERQARLEEQRESILALRSDLESGKKQFVYAKRNYSADEVRDDLSRRFDRFKLAEESLKRDGQVIEARKKALAANEDKLDSMLAAKKDLVVQIENLEARLDAVQAAETVSDLKFDDSQLSRAKELIRQLDQKIGTREKMLNNEGRFTGEIPVEANQEAKKSVNVEQEIDTYFGGASSDQPDA